MCSRRRRGELINSTLQSNAARGPGGAKNGTGGALCAGGSGSTATISGTPVRESNAAHGGGAIAAHDGASASLLGVTVSNNACRGGGGGLLVTTGEARRWTVRAHSWRTATEGEWRTLRAADGAA